MRPHNRRVRRSIGEGGTILELLPSDSLHFHEYPYIYKAEKQNKIRLYEQKQTHFFYTI